MALTILPRRLPNLPPLPLQTPHRHHRAFAATAAKPSALPPRAFNEQRYARSLNARMTNNLLKEDPAQSLRRFDDTLHVGTISPSTATWGSAIHAAGKAGRVDKALEYWAMLKSGQAPQDSKIVMPTLPLPERLYTVMINVLTAHKRHEKAEGIFQELQELAKTMGKLASMDAAKSAVFAAASSGRAESALTLVTSYSSLPPLELYSSLFSGLKTARMTREANEIFSKMQVQPDSRSFALLLRMNERDYRTAATIWKRYLNSNFPPTEEAATYAHQAMLLSCIHGREYGHANEIIERISTLGVPRNSALYVAMMNAHLRRNEILSAVTLWTEARSSKIAMDPALLTQGLFVLCRAGKAEEALGLLCVPEYSRFIDLHAINTVIFGALRIGREQTAEKAFELVVSNKLTPDLHSLGPFVQYHCASDNITKATFYFEQLQKLGIQADTPVLNAMVEMCTRLGKDESLLQIYRHALKEISAPQ